MSSNNSLTKRVITAIGLLGSAQAVNIACSVLRNKLMAIWVGPAGVGLNSILVNASTLISTGTQLNIRDSAVRDLSTPMSDYALALKTASVRRWCLLLGIIGVVTAVVLSPLLSATAYSGSMANWYYFALLAPAVFFTAYSAGEMAILQSCGRLKDLARANLTGGLAATIISIPLIYLFRLEAIVYVIDIYAAALAIVVFFMRQRGPQLPSGVRLDLKTLWAQGKSFLALGLTISVSVLLTSLTNYIFSAYINSTGGEDALGTYQSGYTLVNSYVGIIFAAIAVEYYPRLTRFISRPKTARVLMSHEFILVVRLITPVAVIFIALSDFIVRLLYSSQFEGVVPFITFAIGGTVLRGVSLCYAYRILAEGDSKAYIFTESVSVTVGLILNVIAYSLWSYLGLGISYVVWYVSYTALTSVVCRRRYNVVLPLRNYLQLFIALVIIAISIAMKAFVAWWLPLVTLLPLLLIIIFTSKRH